MKNGMNVAAISELVHEIRNVPSENEIDYGVVVSWVGGLNMRAHTKPLRFGTKRLGRDFAFEIGHMSHPSQDGPPTPADLFMLGLGSCVANIMVQGVSYKGITLEALSLQAKADQSSAGLEKMLLELSIHSSASQWQYRQLMMNVSRFSPNYVTVTMPNTIELSCDVIEQGPSVKALHQAALGQPEPYHMPQGALSLGMDLSWRNATQFDAMTRNRHWQGQEIPLTRQVCVDQPTPAAGLNEAPNPQEYLMAAITADLLQEFVNLLAEKQFQISALSAQASCHLDMKGCFNIFDKSAVQLQNSGIGVSLAGTVPKDIATDLLKEASVRSACFQAFISKNKVAIERQGESSQPIEQSV